VKIAILDNKNEDIGLKILFPEADYYYCSTTSDRNDSYLHYNFRPRLDTQNIIVNVLSNNIITLYYYLKEYYILIYNENFL